MRWLVRFGYDGAGFAGWARQPGRRTVEGEIRRGLERSGLVRSADEAAIEVASRTDAGVSARANLLAISLPLDGPALLRALNGIAPDIHFSAARPLPPGRSPRTEALWREYRYYLGGGRDRAARLASIVAVLPPRLDGRSFGRGVPPDRPAIRPIDRLTVRAGRGGIRLEVRAPGFLWGMVRKLVGGLTAVEAGALDAEALLAAAEGRRRLTLPLAPAGPLLLWEVRCPGRWPHRAERRSRQQARHLADGRSDADARRRLLLDLDRAWAPAAPEPGRNL
ncbi:MAG: hypothetical protein QXG65_05040 [Thermoplasmata archaeon]